MTKRIKIGNGVEALLNGRETTVVLVNDDGTTYVGTSRCNRSDKYSEEIGINIALSRAAKALAEETEAIWVGRATSLVDWNAKHGTAI